MILDINKIKANEEYVLDEVINLNSEKYPPHFPIDSIKSIQAKIKARKYDNFLHISLNVKAVVNLICSYSLKSFVYNLNTSDDLNFAYYEEDLDDDIYLIKGNRINLDDYIFDLINLSVPIKPISPDVDIEKIKNEFDIISDNEYRNEGNSKFDKLLDLDID